MAMVTMTTPDSEKNEHDFLVDEGKQEEDDNADDDDSTY